MSESKPTTPGFTPGPWKADASGQHIRAADNQAIARVYDVEPYSLPETEANAHLIAAAPDLYAALKDVLAVASANAEDLDDGMVDPSCESARAALAKADGRS